MVVCPAGDLLLLLSPLVGVRLTGVGVVDVVAAAVEAVLVEVVAAVDGVVAVVSMAITLVVNGDV